MVLCENTTPSLPIPCASPHGFPIYFSICKRKWNQTWSAVFWVPNSFPMWMEPHSGIMSWLPKQSNPGRRGSGNWSGAALSIIIITLKDLHWWREGSQEGLWVMAVQIAPSVDHHGKHKDPVHCNAYEQERLLTMALKVLLLRVHKPVYALASYRRW